MTIRNACLVTAVAIALGLLDRAVTSWQPKTHPLRLPHPASPIRCRCRSDSRTRQATFPSDNPLTVEKIELGKLLFFDPRLSADNKVACGSCHFPFMAWTDGQKVSIGIRGQLASAQWDDDRQSGVQHRSALGRQIALAGGPGTESDFHVGPDGHAVTRGVPQETQRHQGIPGSIPPGLWYGRHA